jgi:hypothetical protein
MGIDALHCIAFHALRHTLFFVSMWAGRRLEKLGSVWEVVKVFFRSSFPFERSLHAWFCSLQLS